MRTATTSEELIAPLTAFSAKFHHAVGDEHHVASPLGAWLLLAMSATAARGSERDRLAESLGMDVDQAAALVTRLLENPHPAVASAAAVWTAARFDTEALRQWRAWLPSPVARGPMPTQAEADAWTAERTLGLISRFPIEITRLTAVLLANALAVQCEWNQPYECEAGRALGFQPEPSTRPEVKARAGGFEPRPWADRLQLVFRSGWGAEGRIVRTREAGDVAVHRRDTTDGLALISVIADRNVSAATVIAAACTLASELVLGRGTDMLSLYDLRLGHAPLWTITEEETTTPGRQESYDSFLPAWSASSTHDLLRMGLGVDHGAAAVTRLCAAPMDQPQAVQSVVARYARTGFEAAALSAIHTRAFGREPFVQAPQSGLLRRAILRFGHPFAVVAVPQDPFPLQVTPEAVTYGPWHGLPVFSAWVTEPEEAELGDPESMSEMDRPFIAPLGKELWLGSGRQAGPPRGWLERLLRRLRLRGGS